MSRHNYNRGVSPDAGAGMFVAALDGGHIPHSPWSGIRGKGKRGVTREAADRYLSDQGAEHVGFPVEFDFESEVGVQTPRLGSAIVDLSDAVSTYEPQDAA